MGKARFKISVQIILAFLLLAVSCWMLLQPWAEISVEIKGKEYSMSGLIKYMGTYMDLSEKEMRSQIEEGLKDGLWSIEDDLDINLKAKAGAEAIENLLDGEFTLLDISSVVTWVANMLKAMEEVYADVASLLPGVEMPKSENFSTAVRVTNLASAALWGLYAVIALSFLFALYSLFTGRKAGVIAYTVMAALPAAAFIAAVLLGNHALVEEERSIREALNGILYHFGYEVTARVDFEILKLTLHPFICFLSPICALLILAIPTPQRSSTAKKKAVKASEAWAGPAAVNRYADRQENRPADSQAVSQMAGNVAEPVQGALSRCACGAEIKPGAVFCVYCGRSLKANLWTCPVCGTESSIVNKFCSVCGSKRPEKKLCECGAELSGETAFCPNCGRKTEK